MNKPMMILPSYCNARLAKDYLQRAGVLGADINGFLASAGPVISKKELADFLSKSKPKKKADKKAVLDRVKKARKVKKEHDELDEDVRKLDDDDSDDDDDDDDDTDVDEKLQQTCEMMNGEIPPAAKLQFVRSVVTKHLHSDEIDPKLKDFCAKFK